MIETARNFCEEALNEFDREKPDYDHKGSQDKNRSAEAEADSRQDCTREAPWPSLDKAAYYGAVGEIVHTIEPHSEADPASLLIHTLVSFGNVVGNSPYYKVESDYHHANLFAVLVGTSAKGRKGTSAGRIRSVIKNIDAQWSVDRNKSGLSSGEGFINEIRDPIERWDSKTKEFETIDPGISDKRLMITEPEFANALEVMARPGNTLSPNIRNGWDGQTLSTLTKNSPLKASKPHISIIGHITEEELRARLTRTDIANGFANRFLLACVRRSKLLPHGGNLADAEIERLGEKMAKAFAFAKAVGRVEMTPSARKEWETVYPHLSAEQPGLLGAITARAEAQTIRLALIYALLDQRDEIDVPHLRAALAVWEYCESSAARIFGNALGDPIADEIIQALRQAAAAGMTRTAIRDSLGRHQTGDRIGIALSLLSKRGLATMTMTSTAGRPTETWFAVDGR